MRASCDRTGPLYHKYEGGGLHLCRAANMHNKARGVRWNEELQLFEMKCDRCYSNRGRYSGGGFWPLTPEFWSTTEGVQECRACIRDRKRKYQARRRAKCTEDWDKCRCGMPNRKTSSKLAPLEYVDERELVA